jgi:glutamate synthase domain-containing protein 3
LLFDLLNRTYHYPLEYIIEAMAPTAELDFDKLPEDKRDIYRAIQATHIHGSPDGPWFFIIARNDPVKRHLQLLGITDTAMLRPQVFAFSEGEVQVGLICSEKQAIDATLLSLSREDKRICPVADRYWNARGGSHTDGGAFIFNLEEDSRGRTRMTCTDKFGVPVSMPGGKACDFSTEIEPSATVYRDIEGNIKRCFEEIDAAKLFEYLRGNIPLWSFDDFRTACRMVTEHARDSKGVAMAIRVLTMLNDFRYPRGLKKRSHMLHIVRGELNRLFKNLPRLDAGDVSGVAYRLIDYDSRDMLREPLHEETTLVIDARRFPPDGNDCDAAFLVNAFIRGWRHFICFNGIGQRFIGCGLGPETDGVTIDVYGSSGDYLGSGIDGLTITVHNNAQDQLGQIIKRGKLVVYGDVGQTFMYGAKGGEVYVLGNAAGRPLINSVGRPRVVINGTCLDFLGESFMAGDPHERGGFIILNSVTFDHDDRLIELEEPYPGSNLFSLASGGAIYVRDPHEKVVEQQLNGGVLDFLEERDWELMVPYLAENERLFGIMIDDLLTVNGQRREPIDVYRKVTPSVTRVLASESYDSRVEEKTVKEAVMDKEVQ